MGRTQENYQVRDLATMVSEVVPGSKVSYAVGGGPDPRCYRVNCDKIAKTLPAFQPQWTVRKGMEELFAAMKRYGMTREDFVGARYQRIKTIQKLMSDGRLDGDLRWSEPKESELEAAGRSVTN